MERSSSDHQLPKQQQQQNNQSSLLSPPQNPKLESNNVTFTDSPRNVDRLKRDEWSEGAVSALLEAYEAKWTLRNRAKLKGQDWEDVAKQVSCRANGSKPAKTQTQCKNKIESMKKRYRSESTAVEGSSWPLYPRLDLLLRGNGGGMAVELPSESAPPSTQVEAQPPQPPAAVVLEKGSGARNLDGSNDGGDHRLGKDGDGTTKAAKLTNSTAEKNPVLDDDDTESSTPETYAAGKEKANYAKPPNSKTKKRTRDGDQYYMVGESIRWVAEVVVRSEQARMETMREIERMRAEAEAKRGEIDLRRTEIIANTQLQIAKLFAKGSTD